MTDVAVIIAAYNAAGTIDDALASVSAQTLAPAEVIVADDCSTDATSAVVAAWADRLPITQVRASHNAGPADARALAIEASQSPLVALLDADDVWLPDHLATLRALHRPELLVMADLIFWVPGEGLGARWTDLYAAPTSLRSLYRINSINSCTLFARSTYEWAGGFRGPFRVGEDWDLWIRMLRAGAAVVVADHPTVHYRMKPANDGAFDDRHAVLSLARAEAVSGGERRAVRAGMRALRAERHLFAAYHLAASEPWAARWHGVLAVGGRRRVAVRGAAMAVAPRRVAARRDLARADRLRG